MDLAAAGLTQQPFRTHGDPVALVPYASYTSTLEAIRESCRRPTGLALLHGPPLSGKSTVIRQLVDSLDEDRGIAVVDGNCLNTAELLEDCLHQFGYDIDFDTTNEMLAMLRVFALQQTVSQLSPVLVVENVHRLQPSALRALADVASVKYRHFSALKMVLVGDRPLDFIVKSPELASIARRVSADLYMRSMTCEESKYYMHEKLRAAGSAEPEYVFPDSVCVELWDASGGWPGVLDRLALLAFAKAESLPVAISSVERPLVPQYNWDAETIADLDQALGELPQSPRLFITRDGITTHDLSFDKPRLMIGRSEHNDIAIPSRFVSRHHLLLIRNGDSTLMMDLNSSNGTYVNSKRVSNHVLRHDDVIMIGHHRIKFSDPSAAGRDAVEDMEFMETAVMKTLKDAREDLAQENTEILPAVSEDLPTYGKQ